MTNNKTIKKLKECNYSVLEALVNSLTDTPNVAEEDMARFKEACLFTLKVAVDTAIERAYEEGKNSKNE